MKLTHAWSRYCHLSDKGILRKGLCKPLKHFAARYFAVECNLYEFQSRYGLGFDGQPKFGGTSFVGSFAVKDPGRRHSFAFPLSSVQSHVSNNIHFFIMGLNLRGLGEVVRKGLCMQRLCGCKAL
jgi:hypothetical protein